MRKLIASTFTSLDGVMQAPGGPGEDPTGGFSLGGWSCTYWDEVKGLKHWRGDEHLCAGGRYTTRIIRADRAERQGDRAARQDG